MLALVKELRTLLITWGAPLVGTILDGTCEARSRGLRTLS